MIFFFFVILNYLEVTTALLDEDLALSLDWKQQLARLGVVYLVETTISL